MKCKHDIMMKKLLKAKLHRATVTGASLHYEGSCGIDEALLEASGMCPNEYIEIYNVCNGERFSTYIIPEPRGSGEITLNGAAARKALVSDLLIICTYALYSEAEFSAHKPVIVLLEPGNKMRT